jgi:hypothetical protein
MYDTLRLLKQELSLLYLVWRKEIKRIKRKWRGRGRGKP